MNTVPFVSDGHNELEVSEDEIPSSSAPCAPSHLDNYDSVESISSSHPEWFEEACPSELTDGNGPLLSPSTTFKKSVLKSPASVIIVDQSVDHYSSPETTVLRHTSLPACAGQAEVNTVNREHRNNTMEGIAMNQEHPRDDFIIANAVAVNDLVVDAQMMHEQPHPTIHQGQVWWQKKYLCIAGILFMVAAFAMSATLLAIYVNTKLTPFPDKITQLPSTLALTPAYPPTPSSPAYLTTSSSPAYLTTSSTPAYSPLPLTTASLPEFQTNTVRSDGTTIFQVYAAVTNNEYNISSTDVLDNADCNDILIDVQRGFVELALQVAYMNDLPTVYAFQRDDDFESMIFLFTTMAPSQKLHKRFTQRQLRQRVIQRACYLSYYTDENITTEVWDLSEAFIQATLFLFLLWYS